MAFVGFAGTSCAPSTRVASGVAELRYCGKRQVGSTVRKAARASGMWMARARVPISDVLKSPKWPEKWPFNSRDFTRADESADNIFYSQPRFVTHIDDDAIKALTEYYAKTVPHDSEILDLCSSWISHFPKNFPKKRAVGIGMNFDELKRNEFLDEYLVVDLNQKPELPFEDSSFDVITNAVSVDYLMKPQQIFEEMGRVLRPGGIAIMSFSNRCFPTKVSQLWLNTSDAEHVFIVGSFFHYAGSFQPAEGIDISPKPGRSDPMYIVQAKRIP